jgi:hypothetical protein
MQSGRHVPPMHWLVPLCVSPLAQTHEPKPSQSKLSVQPEVDPPEEVVDDVDDVDVVVEPEDDPDDDVDDPEEEVDDPAVPVPVVVTVHAASARDVTKVGTARRIMSGLQLDGDRDGAGKKRRIWLL